MSNIHSLHVVGSVPYDWANHLTPEEAQLIAAFLLAPAIGIHLEYTGQWMGPENKNHGHTTFYNFIISGDEALRGNTMVALVNVFRRLGKVVNARAADVENHGSWFQIPEVLPEYKAPAMNVWPCGTDHATRK